MNDRLRFPTLFTLPACALLLATLWTSPAMAQKASAPTQTAQKQTAPPITYAPEDLQAIKRFTTDIRNDLRTLQRAAASSRPHTIDEALRAVPSPKTPANIFRWLVDNIVFEPYQGALRGPTGALIAGSANSVDQALLLSAMLQKAGYKTRFVQGTMHDHDLTQTLLGFTGSVRLNAPKNTNLLKNFTPEDFTTNAQYTQFLATHLWLEVQQPDGQYLPADPVLAPLFGMTPATAIARSETLPEAFQANLEIQLISSLKDQQESTSLTLAGPLEEYAYRTISLGFTPDEIQKNTVHPVLKLDNQPTSTKGAPFPTDQLAKLELRYTIKIGRRETRWTQTLYLHDAASQPTATDKPSQSTDFTRQHFAISFIPGWTANDQLTRISLQSLSRATEQLSQITAKNQTPHHNLHNTLDELAPLIHFTYLRNLDRLTLELSNLTGVRPILQTPRVVTTATTHHNNNTLAITLNLQGDTLETIPMNGVPAAAATGLRTLYGRIKNQLENELLTSVSAPNTTGIDRIFRQARRDKIPFATLHASSPDYFKQLKVPSHTRAELEELTNQRGRILLVPTRPVLLQEHPYYGWWTLQPQNGALQGHGHNALFATQPAAPPTLSEQLRATLRLSTGLHTLVQQTLDHATPQQPRICQARTDVHRLASAFCATTSLQKLPTLEQCLTTAPASTLNPLTPEGLLTFAAPTCEQQLKETRCGAVITAALLDGTLRFAAPEIPQESSEVSEVSEVSTEPPAEIPPYCS